MTRVRDSRNAVIAAWIRLQCDRGGGIRIDYRGGATGLARVVAACEATGAWCLIGGPAVNTYVEPVYTLDASLVVVASGIGGLAERLREQGFAIEEHEHSLNAKGARSDLRIQFTTDRRYQDFPARAVGAVVLGVPVRVACLEDTAQGKVWAYGDPKRRFSERRKDELDLIRLAEARPGLRAMYPRELVELIGRA